MKTQLRIIEGKKTQTHLKDKKKKWPDYFKCICNIFFLDIPSCWDWSGSITKYFSGNIIEDYWSVMVISKVKRKKNPKELSNVKWNHYKQILKQQQQQQKFIMVK